MIVDYVKLTIVSWATAMRTLVAQMRGAGTEGADDSAEGLDSIEVTQPLGLRVRPVIRSSLEAVVLTRGDERIALFLVDKARRAGAVEPEAGGVTLHGLAEESAVIYIRASGDIEITPKAARNVILAGGSTPVAKEGSATSGHQHAAGTMTAGPWAVVGVTATATDTVAAGAGSARIKVP